MLRSVLSAIDDALDTIYEPKTVFSHFLGSSRMTLFFLFHFPYLLFVPCIFLLLLSFLFFPFFFRFFASLSFLPFLYLLFVSLFLFFG